MLDQPSSENRAESRCYRRQSGPCPDRLTSSLFFERRTNDRKTARDQECSGNSLERTPQQEGLDAFRKTAAGGSNCKCNDAQQEHCPPSDSVAQCPPNKDQSREK